MYSFFFREKISTSCRIQIIVATAYIQPRGCDRYGRLVATVVCECICWTWCSVSHVMGVFVARRVEAPAGVTTRWTRALGVSRGDSPPRVGPRRGCIHGKHAEWSSRSQLWRAARPNHSIQLEGLASAGGGIPTSPTSS